MFIILLPLILLFCVTSTVNLFLNLKHDYVKYCKNNEIYVKINECKLDTI